MYIYTYQHRHVAHKRASSLTANIVIIVMHVYHAHIDALGAHMIHINPDTIFHVTRAIYIKYYLKKKAMGKKT